MNVLYAAVACFSILILFVCLAAIYSARSLWEKVKIQHISELETKAEKRDKLADILAGVSMFALIVLVALSVVWILC